MSLEDITPDSSSKESGDDAVPQEGEFIVSWIRYELWSFV